MLNWKAFWLCNESWSRLLATTNCFLLVKNRTGLENWRRTLGHYNKIDSHNAKFKVNFSAVWLISMKEWMITNKIRASEREAEISWIGWLNLIRDENAKYIILCFQFQFWNYLSGHMTQITYFVSVSLFFDSCRSQAAVNSAFVTFQMCAIANGRIEIWISAPVEFEKEDDEGLLSKTTPKRISVVFISSTWHIILTLSFNNKLRFINDKRRTLIYHLSLYCTKTFALKCMHITSFSTKTIVNGQTPGG